MAAENDVLVVSLLDRLLNAVKKDDIHVATHLFSENPELLETFATIWEVNPLLFAFNHGSFRVAEEIARRKPQFAGEQYPDVYTAMLLASAKGDLLMVKVLAHANPQLCFFENNVYMIPLQTAVVNGHDEIIRELVSASPLSLWRVTSQKETVFHLALKNCKYGTFQVLMEEMEKLNQDHHLLNWKDHEGNTVLHIATSKKLVKIVEMLLSKSSSNQFVMKVNSVNKEQFTALDLYYQMTHRDSAAQKIGHILRKAGAEKGRQTSAKKTMRPQPLGTSNKRSRRRWTLETRNVLLVVLAMIAGASLPLTCNLPQSFIRKNVVANATYPVTSLISLQVPPAFNLLVFNAASFIVSMGTIVVITWSLPLGAVLLFVSVSISIVFVILVDHVMPIFSVKVGSLSISSFGLVWMVAIVFIVVGIVVVSKVKWLISWVFKEHKASR